MIFYMHLSELIRWRQRVWALSVDRRRTLQQQAQRRRLHRELRKRRPQRLPPKPSAQSQRPILGHSRDRYAVIRLLIVFPAIMAQLLLLILCGIGLITAL